MFVLSQNKEILGTFKKFTVERNLGGGKEAKFAILGYSEGTASVLGVYAEKKFAVAELEKILSALLDNKTAYMVE